MTVARTRRASPEKTRPSVFWPLAGVVVPIAGLMARIEIEGGENLPMEGAYVLAPNHYSEFDPVVVAVATWRLGRAPRFMVKEGLFRVPVLGWALRATGMVPVSRAGSASTAKQTIETAERLISEGNGVIVYPEGSLTRDPDLWPMRGKTGAVRVALAGGLPVIPMATWGVQRILPRYGKLSLWPPRKRVRILVGPPVDLSAYAGRATQHTALVEATDVVMSDIAELQGRLRGETPPAERWDPAIHGQKETGRLES
ncbi:1-acyl-sn-glycerol-3-phosphate acyltransferase [Microbacterium sp. zg.Y1090]|uniref:lysophospholipid acyltransferase family protein n=1 Tax=Microbacterium TaxID=33882 RepID=UPI00214C625F|nr:MULTISPECIES: lysophospholipid acyltransferase family protein [unclassified Microbacterium]MCR2811611.1 1-acyl-sn-glycerol-3-phosphate acyltransferase [Microbacterium sp. zg.Y1084]MCR2818967.1 1-acyl-sn-glycerol-3-phosphate acyltransferase [Microbacterium sp. zg.Y1090]MDL5487617.1 lysophospholipid acyltransferase family protein [Microbacterium sp. zg-Y1211]WIM27272.1 lysophospholipid acyltransferase family protein [Microbacterium sp. zg-Y1090]